MAKFHLLPIAIGAAVGVGAYMVSKYLNRDQESEHIVEDEAFDEAAGTQTSEPAQPAGEDAQPEVPTIHRFARNLRQSGITKAYALDGGQTAVIAMDGELINAVLYGHQRKISDIIYFATAIPGKQHEERET